MSMFIGVMSSLLATNMRANSDRYTQLHACESVLDSET